MLLQGHRQYHHPSIFSVRPWIAFQDDPRGRCGVMGAADIPWGSGGVIGTAPGPVVGTGAGGPVPAGVKGAGPAGV